MRIMTLFLLFLGVILARPANADEINLGFGVGMGTYTVPVYIKGVGERPLTFDTGASYTIVDKKDVATLHLSPTQNASVYLPYEGKRLGAYFVIIPEMQIGNCHLHNRKVMVMDLPKGRPGALGMNDLEELAPFTFTKAGRLQLTCPN